MTENKPKNQITPGTFTRLLQYIFSHYKLQLLVVGLCIIVAAIGGVIATVFLQQLVDQAITPGLAHGLASVYGKLISIILTMIAFYVAAVACSAIYTQLMAVITQGTLKYMRDDMFSRMETLPIRYFDRNAAGDIMSTYTNDTDAIRQLIGQSLPTLVQTILTMIALTISMLRFSVWMTLMVFAFMLIMTRVTKIFGGTSARSMVAQQKALAKEEGFVQEMMAGQKVVKVFNHETAAITDFKAYNEELFAASDKANSTGFMLMPILGNIGNIMYIILAVFGGILIAMKATNISLQGISPITIGVIVSFLAMARNMSQQIGQASMQVSLITLGLAGASRVFDLMDQEPESDDGYVELVNAKYDDQGKIIETSEKTDLWAWKHPHQDGTVTYVPLAGEVVMDDVTFGYDPNKTVLHNVSLFAKPGQKIAFVGATGAGKTTITNLINRFYDIPDGKIRYDGININKIKKPDLRRSLGIVLQEVNLFTGTVMDNIRYGRLDATDEECIAAAKLANADDFIQRLPEGYQTLLSGNGAELSQGQRQLLSIARAAVADPPVMIMDEATSSIDTRTEALVQAGMDNLMKGRTVFVIAHRLSTVRNSDAIMVLDHGRIIERGMHAELIAQKGTYYQLYTGAFELE
ncbi:ATP-binding cassette, subfamily B [Ligilactobacillus sp. WC1T17]|uniref:ATP-binding cassette, subfamily B n=1 Tax=Ligilactobacillus ruminis TaxID=1623 RepID=A0ABY1ADI5_9LACO|nr:ATP-binding cassette, subfamily B [Ligilactobacillus ruminis]